MEAPMLAPAGRDGGANAEDGQAVGLDHPPWLGMVAEAGSCLAWQVLSGSRLGMPTIKRSRVR